MMTLILGGSGSGKSSFAENYTLSLADGMTKYYIATMQVFDSEGQKKVLKHQMQRSGKGFLTIEQPTDLGQSLEKMESGKKTALLECMSNLTANEMFRGEEPEQEEIVIQRIVTAVKRLKENLSHFIIVSNNVFEDGRVYDETTMAYIRAMGSINAKLAEMADEVVEVVVGIPVYLKRGKEERCTF